MNFVPKENLPISPESYLVLWNDNLFANDLRKIFGDNGVITSIENLRQQTLTGREFAGAVVLVELSWEGNRHSQLYGIEIVKNILRVEKEFKSPILFVSFFSLKQILKDDQGNKRLENQIVGAVGHDFLRLPVIPSILPAHLERLKPLNELQYADIYNNLCNLKGLIHGRIHELQGRFRSLETAPIYELRTEAKSIFESGLDEIANLLKNISDIPGLNRKFKRDFKENILAGDFKSKEILEFLDQYSAAISVLVFEDQNENEITDVAEKFTKPPWKVLLLDDEPDSLGNLRRNLEKRGIEYFLAQTVNEAEKIITDDIYNEITVAVSDYRLLEEIDGVEKHQRKQGYDFLFWLAEQDHLTHLIALSGLSRKFLLESFQKYNTRVDVHSKQDLTGDRAVNLFIDNILDRGNEIYGAICSRPSVGYWKDLRPFYAAHRASTDYQLKEQEINNRASQYLRQYNELLESKDEKQLLRPDLDVLKNLTAGLDDKQPTDPRAMDIFYNKLIARRIGLWLQLKLNFSPNQIFAALQGHLNPESKLEEIKRKKNGDNFTEDNKAIEKLEKEANLKYKRDMTYLVTSSLCLSAFVTGFELLVEEKYWLKKMIGVGKFNSSFELARQIPYLVQIFVERFLDSSSNIEQKLKDKHQNLFVVYGKEENKKIGKLQVLGFTDAKEVIESLVRLASSEDEKQDLCNLLKILYKNIAANIGESQRRNEFLDYLDMMSDSLHNQFVKI